MIELRDASSGFWSLTGHASTWGKPYLINSPQERTFYETVVRNAFAGATAGKEDVELRLEHRGNGPKFASVRQGSLNSTTCAMVC